MSGKNVFYAGLVALDESIMYKDHVLPVNTKFEVLCVFKAAKRKLL